MAEGVFAGKGEELVPINPSTILSISNTHLFNGPQRYNRHIVSQFREEWSYNRRSFELAYVKGILL